MITKETVRKMFEDINGPSDLSEKVLEKTAKYGNFNDYEAGDEALMTALDIFRLQESGETFE
jgi:hypothetical protein